MEIVKRKPGRPKGSKNKRKALSADLISHQCDRAGHNPVAFLIGVADGSNNDYDWTRQDRFNANVKLADYIHGSKRITQEIEQDQGNGQYQLLFEQPDGTYALPGAPDTGSAETIHGPAAVQCAGVPSTDGQDGICDQQTDS